MEAKLQTVVWRKSLVILQTLQEMPEFCKVSLAEGGSLNTTVTAV